MQTLNAQTVPLAGSNLIEASAGTGKTWTISWLYLRLVAVYGLAVNQILVVTYTDAATAELRDRIRTRLNDALIWLEGRPGSTDTYPALLESAERALCIARLQLALVSFDEAAVFTIHGFCKRILAENAFEAHLPFESELVAGEEELLSQLADAFWYQHFLTPDPLHLALLQQHGLTPDTLLADISRFIGKPYLLENIPSVDSAAFAGLQVARDAAFRACQQCWVQTRDEVEALLLAGSLNGTSYSKKHVPNWCVKLDQAFGGAEGFLADVLARFSTAALLEKTKPGKATPQHPFFGLADTLLEAHAQQQTALASGLEAVRLQLLHHLRRELPRRKQQLGFLTFDDLLLYLHQALQQHPQFATRLAAQYPAALIDEFQDTDPIQYEIFESIYRDKPDARVFYVGDPKQAIYGFRGADIYTYLRAAESVQHQYTLARNFRSHADLLQALNHLFAQSGDPFQSGNKITYEPVEAGRAQAEIFLPSPLEGEGLGVRGSSGIAPIRLWDWDKLGAGDNSAAVQTQIAEAVADDIARLLNAGKAGLARIGDSPVCSRDIAVLVRSNHQGELVKQALQARGVSSVLKSRASIFNAREATELRAVLRAIAEPGNEMLLKQALVTELGGYAVGQLHTLDEQPELLEVEMEAFHEWHRVWHAQGFMPMFRQWLLQGGLYARLLGMEDGERRLTNLLHLAELVHTTTHLHGHGMHALIRWLQQKARAAQEEETSQLRLESDENLVQITTIHKSKGLEYSIVYCPYLWLERDPKPAVWFSWYDDAEGASRLQADALAEEAEKARFRQDEAAENLRLLYVALTRAKYHCTVVLATGEINTFSYRSALTSLLFGELPDSAALLGKLSSKGMPAPERKQRLHAHLAQIVATAHGNISHEPLPVCETPVCYQADAPSTESTVRRFTHRLPPVPKVGSFSGLSSGKDDETPDYDTAAWSVPAQGAATRTAFPRGTQAGSCLHKMLEELDFTVGLAAQRERVLKPALQRHGIGAEWLAAAEQLLADVLRAPLGCGLALSSIPKQRRLDELEFYFPVQGLGLRRLQTLLHRHLPAGWVAIHQAVDRLKFTTLNGFMKGFVDLVFEAGGQYFVVDYKSNELGGAPEDYTEAAMHAAMAEHHYYLQYLIYCLALHRYLRQRLQGYAWERHVGGALYLFLRGMQPGSAPSGIFFHKPDLALMEALDALMA